MDNLGVADEGSVVLEVARAVPKAAFVRFRPLEAKFAAMRNPKAELEAALRNFAVVTEGDSLVLELCGEDHELQVMEVKPASPSKVSRGHSCACCVCACVCVCSCVFVCLCVCVCWLCVSSSSHPLLPTCHLE
jgi:hypothetical protein